MILKKAIDNVEKYLFENSFILFRSSNKSLFLNDEMISNSVSSFQIIGGFVYFNQDRVLHVYNISNGEFQIRNHPFPSLEIQNGKFLNISNSELDPNDFGYSYIINTYSYPEGEKLNSTTKKYKIGYGIWRDPNFYFENGKGFIFSFHLPTENTLWQFSVSELGAEKVSKILGVFGQVLVVVCDYTKERMGYQDHYEKVLGINTANGELLYEVNEYELEGETKLLKDLRGHWTFNEGENLLQALFGDYFVLDSQSGKLEVINTITIAEKTGLNAMMSSMISGNKLAFRAVDNLLGGFPNAIGVFNTTTLIIDWHLTLEEAYKSGGFVKPGQPQLSENKVYALDSNNTLHIFEKE